jgi:hypothetical protein
MTSPAGPTVVNRSFHIVESDFIPPELKSEPSIRGRQRPLSQGRVFANGQVACRRYEFESAFYGAGRLSK